MTRSDDPGIQGWMALLVLVGYWWFIARALRSLLCSARELGEWFRDWREEGAR